MMASSSIATGATHVALARILMDRQTTSCAVTPKHSKTPRPSTAALGTAADATPTPCELFPTHREKARSAVVLIVERDPVLRCALYEGLGDAGYRCVTACDRL